MISIAAPGRHSLFGMPSLVGAVALCSALGCGGESHTLPSDCPELPLYDVREGPTDSQQAILDEAARKGCITARGSAVSLGARGGGTAARGGGESTDSAEAADAGGD